jgi:hypothetical protein
MYQKDRPLSLPGASLNRADTGDVQKREVGRCSLPKAGCSQPPDQRIFIPGSGPGLTMYTSVIVTSTADLGTNLINSSFKSDLVEKLTWSEEEDHFYFHNTTDQTKDIVRRVANGLSPKTSARDALETMKLCFAAEKSAISGKIETI